MAKANPIKEKPGASPSTPTEVIDHLIVGPGPTKHSHKGLILLGLALLVIGAVGSMIVHNATPKTAKPTQTTSTPDTTQLPVVQTVDAQVSLTSAGFIPANLRLKIGSQVTWTNTDSAAQSITSSQLEDLVSDTLNPKDSYSFTFEKAGTYTISDSTSSMTIIVAE